MRNLLGNLWTAIGGLTTVLDVAGAGLVVYAAHLVYAPAAYAVGGLALLVISRNAAAGPGEVDE